MPFCLSACAEFSYYAQAVRGQAALLAAARPVQEVLADPEVSPKLKAHLELSQQMRDFAISELELPDNASYRQYAHLDRPYALWNVVATPELSLQALQWCFPIAGCVAYRGYYSEAAAQQFAAELRAQAYDVQVSGTAAYSTLGWFSDPLLSSFINYPEEDLARLMFHELAHQKMYLPGDSQWNESFATAVELAGVTRWLHCKKDAASLQRFQTALQRQQDFLQLLLAHRQELQQLYLGDADPALKRSEKQRIFQQLRTNYAKLKQTWGAYTGYDRWFAQSLGNAHLSAVATYHDLVPPLSNLLRQQQSFADFYQAVQKLAALPPEQRQQAIQQLSNLRLAAGSLEMGPCASKPIAASGKPSDVAQ